MICCLFDHAYHLLMHKREYRICETKRSFFQLRVDEIDKGGGNLFCTKMLLRRDFQILFPPILELEKCYPFVQHNKCVRSRHLQLATGNTTVNCLFVDDVLHDGVRQAVYKSNVVRATELFSLLINRRG